MSRATTHEPCSRARTRPAGGARGARRGSRRRRRPTSSRIVRNARPTMPFCDPGEHPHDADDGRGDERADRDPDRGAQRAASSEASVPRATVPHGGRAWSWRSSLCGARPHAHPGTRSGAGMPQPACCEPRSSTTFGVRRARAARGRAGRACSRGCRRRSRPRAPPPPRRRRGSASSAGSPIGVMPPYSMPVSATASSIGANDADAHVQPAPHHAVHVGSGGREHHARGEADVATALALDHDAVRRGVERARRSARRTRRCRRAPGRSRRRRPSRRPQDRARRAPRRPARRAVPVPRAREVRSAIRSRASACRGA